MDLLFNWVIGKLKRSGGPDMGGLEMWQFDGIRYCGIRTRSKGNH